MISDKIISYLKHSALVVVLALVIASGVAVYYKTVTPHRGAQAEISDFSRHQKVTPDSRLYMAFADEMDHSSVEKNLETPSGVKGAIRWEGKALVFEPNRKLTKEERITFQVARTALLANQKPVGQDLEFKFDVSGPPVVSAHFPLSDATDVDSKTRISMVFDRPIIPLSAVQGQGAKKYVDAQGDAKDWPVTITPETPGRWRWMGTSAIEFIPKENWVPATAYTIHVPRGITTVIGDTTEDDFSWSFTTLRPVVINTAPYDGYTTAGPQSEVLVTFNQEMDLNRLGNQIQLLALSASDKTKTTPVAVRPGYGVREVEEGKKETDKTQIQLTPEQPLPFKTNYQIVVPEGVKAARGDLGTVAASISSFSTAGELTVTNGQLQQGNWIQIFFSNPVDDESLKKAFSISPQIPKWEDVSLATDSDSARLAFYAQLQPGTDYTISISTALKDKFGQTLKTPYTLKFTTPPLDPFVSILTKGGELNVMERGRPTIIPFQTVNVSRLDFKIAPLSLNDFIKIQNSATRPDFSTYPGSKKFLVRLKNVKNRYELPDIDLEKEFGKLTSGIYAFSVQTPEYTQLNYITNKQEPIVQYQYLALSSIALTLKYSGNSALVWAVDMKTGDAVKDADIAFIRADGKTVKTGKTDENGFFKTPVDSKKFLTGKNQWQENFWVTASKGDDFSFVGSSWNQGIEPWSFGLWDDFRDTESREFKINTFLYTERRLYRPGDTVYFKGITRLLDKNGVYRLPPKDAEVSVSAMDSRGTTFYEKNLGVNAFGSFSGDFPLDAKGAIGGYSLSGTVLPQENFDNNYGTAYFSVEDYRKPEYKIEVAPEKEDYFDHDSVSFGLKANYYFGAPMSNAKVRWIVSSSDYYFSRYTDGWYSFSLDVWCVRDSCPPTNGTLLEKDDAVDSAGAAKLAFPVDLKDKIASQLVTVSADITDENNQVVSAGSAVPVHKSKTYVGIMPEKWAVEPGQKAKINLVTVGIDGTPRPNQSATVQLFSREWNTIKKKSVDGLYYYDNEPKDTYISQTSTVTREKGKSSVEFTIQKGGSYRVVAEVKDEDGRSVKSSSEFYGYSDTYINWPHSNNDKIDVVADRPTYKVGDTATLLVKSPWQGKGVHALVTVERENIMTQEMIDIVSNAQPIKIPITEAMTPNAYVSVIVIKPRDGDTFDEKGNDTGMPAFKMGYALLTVDTYRKKLDIELKTDKAKYLPGETVRVQAKVTDFEGKPAKTELSLGVVDMSVQDLLGFYMPDLVATFYSNRGLGVRTSEMLSYLVEVFKPGTKGGGGGDLDPVTRKNFKDTAYWNPSVVTNDQGEAEVSFKLPDNLTTWQVLAIGNNTEHLFGAQAMTFIETKKTIVRPVLPRFAMVGDTMSVGAIVHNFLDNAVTFNVFFTGSGFKAKDETQGKLTLKPGENRKMTFPIEILPGTKAVFHFKVETSHGASSDTPAVVDEIEQSIPVTLFGANQSVATSGIVSTANNNKATETVFVPSKDDASLGSLVATLSPTLATYLSQSLSYLATFPYGCAEQTASSFLPNVILSSLKDLNVLKTVDDKTLEKNITAGLEKLYSFQRGDGGFGYWIESYNSAPYLSAYIVHVLEIARASGISVDSGVIQRVADYLQNFLRDEEKNQQDYDRTTRAYILFVLAETNHGDLSLLNNLYSKRKDLPLFAQAYLAMAFKDMGSDKAATIVREILGSIKVDARGAHFEEKNNDRYYYAMNTNDRTTALVLQAILRVMPDHPLIPNIVRSMLTSRREGRWDTTQSTVASLMALIDYLKNTRELEGTFTASAKFNNDPAVTQAFNKENQLTRKEIKKAFSELAPDAMNTIVFTKNNNSGRLYYDLLMSYFLTIDALPPADEGIGIRREITAMGDKDEKKLTDSFDLLQTYKVKLTITVPEDRHFVAVESLLPAGFEPINFNFRNSQQRFANESGGSWAFEHQELHDDRVFLFAEQLSAGVYDYTYLVRATTPGRFHEGPARAWEMYYPENFGQTEGKWVEVKG
ncbi:Ig-like domain-containing protein [Candidatus Peregrinibacteria bacterium]|nr:Ig-like domain-containing protein [Candidatus Peregrinibacteria bacterium]